MLDASKRERRRSRPRTPPVYLSLPGASTERNEEQNLARKSAHIGQLLNLLLPFSLVFLGLSLVAYLIYGDLASGLSAVVLLVFACLTLVAQRHLELENRQTAVVIVCSAILGCSVVMLPIWPSLAPTLAMTPLVTVGVAFSFVEAKVLKALILGAWLSVVLAVAAGEILTGSSSAPVWFDSFFKATSMIAAASLALLLLWQFRTRLVDSLSQSRKAEEMMRHAATHDALTGLPSRPLLEHRLQNLIGPAVHSDTGNPEDGDPNNISRTPQLFSILFLDLDRFKHVNDSLGHAVGDELLRDVSKRLLSCVGNADTVSRLGGDEFVILQMGGTEKDAEQLAQDIQESLKAPIRFYGHELYTTASIGIVCGSADYEEPGEILRDADTAMYRAKVSGKARHAVFDSRMRQRAISLLRLDTDLRNGVEHGEFVVRYQPIVWLASRGVSGFEALVRWQHPERGLLAPNVFMQLAEETGLIHEIDRFVLKEACRKISAWRNSGSYYPPSISVNISPIGFSRPGLPQQIEAALRENDLPGRALTIELTESALMEDPEFALATLEEIKALGVRLHVDDFGTGYSSLWLLQKFPVDALKIDKSFINGIADGGTNNFQIVETIITLAHSLGMEVIAEGVESSEQLDMLRDLGCDFVQGYKFSKPVHPEVAEAILHSEAVW